MAGPRGVGRGATARFAHRLDIVRLHAIGLGRFLALHDSPAPVLLNPVGCGADPEPPQGPGLTPLPCRFLATTVTLAAAPRRTAATFFAAGPSPAGWIA